MNGHLIESLGKMEESVGGIMVWLNGQMQYAFLTEFTYTTSERPFNP